MFKNAQLIRFIPDRPGRGGIRTGVSTFTANTDVRDVYNVYIYNGRWRMMPAQHNLSGTVDQNVSNWANPQVIHNYAKYGNVPGAAPTNYVLAHIVDGQSGDQYINNCNTGYGTIKQPFPTTTICTPAIFTNIKNRCFICWGGTNNFIYDGTQVYDVGVTTPSGIFTYSLNTVGQTSGTCTVTNACSFITYLSGTGWGVGGVNATITLNGTPYLITAYISSWSTVGQTVTGKSGNPYCTINTGWPTDGSYNGLVITISGDPNPYIIGSYTVAGSVTTVYLKTSLSTSPAGISFTLTGSQFQLSTAYSGQSAWSIPYVLNSGNLQWPAVGPEYTFCYYDPVTGHISNGSSITYVTEQNQKNAVITLSGINTLQPDLGGSRFTQILIFRTLLSGGSILYPFNMDTLGGSITTPKNYVSGSCTCVGSAVTLTTCSMDYWPALASNLQFQVGNTVTISSVNYTIATITDATHLTVTGSPSSGTFQWPANGTVGSTGFIDTFTDSNLIPQLQVPQVTNNPYPMIGTPGYGTATITGTTNVAWVSGSSFSSSWVGLPIYINSTWNTVASVTNGTHMVLGTGQTNVVGAVFSVSSIPVKFSHQAYWQGRVWGNGAQDPSAVYFSGDAIQIPFGVPEECYPSNNVLRVSAEDGRVTGMKVVGSYLLIVTDRYTYYVAGTNESNYQLLKFSSTMYGLHDYQMCELAGETTDSEPQVVYLGNDWKVYAFSPSTGSTQISQPIQDKLDMFGNPFKGTATITLNYTVTWLSGDQFNQSWVGQAIYINGYWNQIQAVTSSTLMYLTTSATNVVGASFSVRPANLSDVRMSQIATQGAKWIIISIPVPSSGGNTAIFVYDYENKVWLSVYPTLGNQEVMPFCVQYQNYGTPKLLYLGSDGGAQARVYQWLDFSYSTMTTGAIIRTPPIDLGRKSYKRLNFVRLYIAGIDGTTLQSNPFVVSFQADEYYNYSPIALYYNELVPPIPSRSLFGATTGFAIDSASLREVIYSAPTENMGHRWVVWVSYPNVNMPKLDVLAIDVSLSDLGEEGVTEP